MAPRNSLTILTTRSNKPFKSSRLALPTSPFSPQYPITPPPKQATTTTLTDSKTQRTHSFPPPPALPLNWLWQCHLCHRTYRLGATRRCLDDGHHFCSGTTVVKRGTRHPGGRKVVRHKACQSEFDYQGWKIFGTWKRRVGEEARRRALREGSGVVVFGVESLRDESAVSGLGVGVGVRRRRTVAQKKDCWNECDYPSECRWGRQYGVRTPSPPPVSVPSSPSIRESLDDSSVTVNLNHAAETLLASTATSQNPHDEETKAPSMDDLLACAQRRKRRSTGAAPSPLASEALSPTAPSMEGESESTVLQKAFDGFELDWRKTIEGLVLGLGKGRRGSAPSMSSSTLGMGEKAGSSRTVAMKPKEKSPSRRNDGDL